MPSKFGPRCLEDYLSSSLDESRKTHTIKVGDTEPVDASKGLRNSVELSKQLNLSSRTDRLVAEIEIQRRRCSTLNDLCSDAKLVSKWFCLAAGSNVTYCCDGRRSFRTEYSLPIGEFMFFQFADILICKGLADYYTLDEWAKYLGKLLKPLIVSYRESVEDEYQIPMDEMPDVKKWLYLSFSLLKELAKNPWVLQYDSQWSSSAYSFCDVSAKSSLGEIIKYKHPPGHQPAAVVQKFLGECSGSAPQDLAVVHPVYFLSLQEFKPKMPGLGIQRKDYLHNWGLPFNEYYSMVSLQGALDDVVGDMVETQFVQLLKKRKLQQLGAVKKADLSHHLILHVSLPFTVPLIWRRVRVRADTSLFHLAILLEPIMGYPIRRFAYVYNDPKDGAVFGPMDYDAEDSIMYERYQGPFFVSDRSGMVDDREVYLGQLLRNVDDYVVWTHRLDSHRFFHYLRLEESSSAPSSGEECETSCALLGGNMRCPRDFEGGNEKFSRKMKDWKSAKKVPKKRRMWLRLCDFQLAKHRNNLDAVMKKGDSCGVDDEEEEEEEEEPFAEDGKLSSEEEEEELDGEEATDSNQNRAIKGVAAAANYCLCYWRRVLPRNEEAEDTDTSPDNCWICRSEREKSLGVDGQKANRGSENRNGTKKTRSILAEMGEDEEIRSKFEASVTEEALDRATAKIKAMIAAEKRGRSLD